MSDEAPDNVATDEEIIRARNRHGEDGEIEIDDGAAASRGDDGLWVAAWVWIPNP